MNTTAPAAQILRRNILAVATLALLCIICLRFFQYQILKHERYATYAENNSIQVLEIPAPRGMILDRFGRYLVTNLPLYSLAVIPAEIQDSTGQLLRLARYLHMEEESMFTKIEEAARDIYQRYRPIVIYEDISFTQRSYLQEHKLEFPGILFVNQNIRHYPSRASATHIIGYLRRLSDIDQVDFVGKGYNPDDWVGAAGIERLYETILRGESGIEYRRVDRLLRNLGGIPDKPNTMPVSGENVILNLDIDLQAKGEQIMDGQSGALIAMDPRNGEILAYVSSPDYPLALFTGSITPEMWERWLNDPEKVMVNRGVNGRYPPGSTLKLVMAAAALIDPDVDPETTYECTGFYQYGDQMKRCNDLNGHGVLNLEDAIRVSCNIYFYNLIQEVTFTKWSEMARLFGFGKITGIDLPSEDVGIVPDRAYMNDKYGLTGWAGGHVLNMGLGQGDVLVTPLQITRMTAAIANHGTLVTPKLVRSPAQARQSDETLPFPDEVWEFLENAMYKAVNASGGTGFRARIANTAVYGKTGTAETTPGNPTHSWFTGYVVTNNGLPLAVTILFEEAGLGSRVAAPLAGEFFQFFVEKYSTLQAANLVQIP
ncbi:penicillin-binding protein 2 [Candidatus Neomarinimicrobiota bacterium]